MVRLSWLPYKEDYMKYKLLVSLASVVILANCIPSVVLNKLWKAEPKPGKSLAIVLSDKNISVDYTGDVKNEFGKGNMTALIKANVKALLYHDLVKEANFHDIWFDKVSSKSSKEILPPAEDNDLESKYAPPVNSNMVLIEHQADYVLLFYGFKIVSKGAVTYSSLDKPQFSDGPAFSLNATTSDEQPGSDFSPFSFEQALASGEFPIAQYPMPMTMPNPTMQQMNNYSYNSVGYSKDLAVSTRFVLWDVKQRCPVVHGFTRNSVSGYFTDYNNWKDIMDKTLGEIMEKTGMLCVKDTVKYTFNHKTDLDVIGTKDKIDLKTGRFKWLFANTITKNDIDSSDVAKMRADSKSAEEMELLSRHLFHFRVPTSPGAEIDTVGSFTKSLASGVRQDLSKSLPSVPCCSEELQKAFQNQALDHFSKFDYPVDTLNSASLELARADSIDYLLVYYGRFSQPKPDNEIKSLDDYDMNFYFNLIDARTNTTLAGYYGSFGNLFDYTSEKSPDKAIRVFEILSMANLKSRVHL